ASDPQRKRRRAMSRPWRCAPMKANADFWNGGCVKFNRQTSSPAHNRPFAESAPTPISGDIYKVIYFHSKAEGSKKGKKGKKGKIAILPFLPFLPFLLRLRSHSKVA